MRVTRLAVLFSGALLAACSATPALPASSRGAGGTWDDPAYVARVVQDAQEAPVEEDTGRGVGHRLLWYIPNRISDVLDIVRARVRVGPGLAVGVRATEFADVFLGSYGAVFVGIPGPRRERSFNWPFGFESKNGVEVSVADATVEGGVRYGWLEFGAGGQLLLIGVDIGVDPWEIVDFAVGLLTFDPEGDDL